MTTMNWRQAAEARVARRAEEYRHELGQFVIAVDDFHGFRPGGGLGFAVTKGWLNRKSDPLVAKYPDRWRPLTEREKDRRVRSEVLRLQFGAGLR